MWLRILAWPVAALVSLSKTFNHCFVLRMGRKRTQGAYREKEGLPRCFRCFWICALSTQQGGYVRASNVCIIYKKVSWKIWSQKWKQYTPFGRIVLTYFKHNLLVWVFCNFFLHFELSICHNHGRSHHIQMWLSEKYLRPIKAVFKGVIKDVFKMYVYVNDLMNITCFHEHDIVHNLTINKDFMYYTGLLFIRIFHWTPLTCRFSCKKWSCHHREERYDQTSKFLFVGM